MTTVHVTGHRNEATASVDSFLANLPELLGAMTIDPHLLVAVIEFEDGRYVQFRMTSERVVIGEVVSNLNIGDAVALTSEDEAMLRRGGWSEPSPGPQPNWRFEAHDVVGLIRLVTMTRDAVLHVLGESATRTVSVRTWATDPTGRSTDEVLYEDRVYYQAALREIERRLNGV